LFAEAATKRGEEVAKRVEDPADADGEDAAGETDGLPQEAAELKHLGQEVMGPSQQT
jgi:hypothetical protein